MSFSLLSVLLLVGCGNQESKNSDNGSKNSSSKVSGSKGLSATTQSVQKASANSTRKSVSSSSSAASSSQKKTDDNASVVKQYLAGKGFQIAPVLYNGENVDQAMEEQKAPQNTVHDYVVFLYFNDASTATTKHIGQITPNSTGYSISDSVITVGEYQIPYSINDGTVTFSQWNADDGNGGTLTYRISANNYTGGNEN